MARTEIDYLRERDDKAQARIVELESQLAELREAAQAIADVLPAPGDDAMKPIDFEGINEYAGHLRAALAASGEEGVCGVPFWGETGRCELPKGHVKGHSSRLREALIRGVQAATLEEPHEEIAKYLDAALAATDGEEK